MSTTKSVQLTVSIIKPHVVKNPWALGNIKRTILDNGFIYIEETRNVMSTQMAEYFYEEHKNKFFFRRLTTFMCSGPIEAYILAREDAICEWRRLMGPTKVYKAIYSEPLSIRALYGLSDTRNAAHGSDSPESVHREINILFPNFSIEEWFKNNKSTTEKCGT